MLLENSVIEFGKVLMQQQHQIARPSLREYQNEPLEDGTF